MEKNESPEDFSRKRMVHVVCFAGSDRSRLIAEELNERGYVASYSGVNKNHNYTTKEDLVGVGSVIFSSESVRKMFKKDRGLNKQLKASQAEVYIIGITESDKGKCDSFRSA